MTRRLRSGRRGVLSRAVGGCVAVALCMGASLDSGSVTPEVSAAPSGSQTPSGSAALTASRPNIILITTDDQSLSDMSVMRHVQARLEQRGTTFSNAYSPYPLCCPARATILTGQYAHNHHVLGNSPPYGGFTAFDDSNTLPLWLQEGGYRTAILGKYLNGYPTAGASDYVAPGWDTWRVPVDGIYNYHRWTLNEDGQQVPYAGRYETNFIGDEASSLVAQYAPERRPYFLWAGFLAPHSGTPVETDDPRAVRTPNVSRRYRDTLAGTPLPDKASINEADVSDKPLFVQQSRIVRRSALRELNQQRLESLLSVDDAVNKLLDAVKASGELSNTVIIFTSDNGFLVGEHRRIGKDIGFQEATRVPLVAAGPGFDTGQTRDQKVSLVDIAPTIEAVAQVSPGLTQDGLPLTTFAGDAQASDARAILLQGGPNKQEPHRWYTGIQTNRYVYIDYTSTGEKELYDLRTDPLQLDNLAVLSPGSAVEHRLSDALATLRRCAGADCLLGIRALSN